MARPLVLEDGRVVEGSGRNDADAGDVGDFGEAEASQRRNGGSDSVGKDSLERGAHDLVNS